MNFHSSITIRWSDEDNAYLVELPELMAKADSRLMAIPMKRPSRMACE
jgi:hypothetical protein